MKNTILFYPYTNVCGITANCTFLSSMTKIKDITRVGFEPMTLANLETVNVFD